MSSRVRLMLQDFGNGTASTGKAAYQKLQELYHAWEKARGGNKTRMREEWVKVENEFAAAHPFSTTMWYREPTQAETAHPAQWEGPGFYQTRMRPQAVQKLGPLPALPTGPKWLVALEMWSRLQETYSNGYKLFISRDGRRHAWRKSLCNPFYQQFAWKAHKAAPGKKAKKAGTGAGHARIFGNDWADTERRFEIPPAPRATRAAQTAETKPAAPKPRVGIWS